MERQRPSTICLNTELQQKQSCGQLIYVPVVYKDDRAALANKTHYGQVEANGANISLNI